MSLEKIRDNKTGKDIVIKRLKKPTSRRTEIREINHLPWSHEAKMTDEEYENLFGRPKITHEEVEVPLTKEEKTAERKENLHKSLTEPKQNAEASFKTHIDKSWITEDEKKELLQMWNEDYENMRKALAQAREHELLLKDATAEVVKEKAVHGGETAAYIKKKAALKRLNELEYGGHPFDIVSGYTWKSYDRYDEITKERMKEIADVARPTFNTPEKLIPPIVSGGKLYMTGRDLKTLKLEDKKKVAMYLKYKGIDLKEIAEKFGVSYATVKLWTVGVRKEKKQDAYERTTTDEISQTGWAKLGKEDWTPKGTTKRISGNYKAGPGRPKGSKDTKPRKK